MKTSRPSKRAAAKPPTPSAKPKGGRRPKSKNRSENEDHPADSHEPGDDSDRALAVVETRHPITLAFESLFQRDLASPERRAQWTLDLTQAVSEGAKKFVGFHNVDSLRQALEINLGLLSLALLIRTEGKEDRDAWVTILQQTTLMELLTEALAHLKALGVERTEFLFLEMEVRPLRETLLAIATARDRRGQGTWIGYREFLREKQSRAAIRTSDRLGRFLIECLLGKSAKTWIERTDNRAGKSGDEPSVHLSADEVINTLILRYCALKPGERIPENIDLQTSYIRRLRAEYEAKPAAWLAHAQSRFGQLLRLLAPEMKEHLRKKNWFALHLQGGPPKPVKSPRPKKSKATDDSGPPEFIDIAGISGVYCYDVYG